MTTKFVVTGDQYRGIDRKMRDIKRQLDGKDGSPFNPVWLDKELQRILEGRDLSLAVPELKADWLTDILVREQTAHLTFFGQEYDLSELEKKLREYGRKQVKRWASLGLEPHFLPQVSMMPGDNYSGWKIKPGEFYYRSLVEGKLFRNQNGNLVKVTNIGLEGVSVLIDTRLKPAYDNGRQMWEKDNLLGSVIQSLRKQGKIQDYTDGPRNSRFGVSANELGEIYRALAPRIGLVPDQFRSELAIEGNAIPQIYSHMPRKNDGETNTWVWYEEFFGGRVRRLSGGNSDNGGLARVYWDHAALHWGYKSFRPLVVL
jgi:hypothetical protein